jgi:hypothetical protein
MDRQRTVDGRMHWQQWSEAQARKALAELAESGETATPAFVAVPLTTGRAQIEIASDGVTVRVREDLDLSRLADIIEVVARSGRGC